MIQNKKIFIHYLPGARGDFLASVLLDSFADRGFGALCPPPDYIKTHHNFSTNEIIKKTKHICIRIDDNKSIDNLMQIMFNSFLKNPTPIVNNYFDHFYARVIDCVIIKKESIDTDNYDYWIDFSRVNDFTFLKTLYYHVHNKKMPNNTARCAIDNIRKQQCWRSTYDLEKLSWLIDFERKFNLFNWCKTFSVSEYMDHKNPKLLLNFSNYSVDKFII